MELEKKMWIRPVTFNFASVTVIAVICALLAILCVWAGMEAFTVGDELKTSIETTRNNAGPEGVGDVEGYGIIVNGIGYLAASGAGIFAMAGAIMLVIVGVMIFAPALLAKLLYQKENGRILAYRIIMGIDYGIITVLAVSLLLMMEELSALIVVPGGLLVIVVCGIFNTYTDRIWR